MDKFKNLFAAIVKRLLSIKPKFYIFAFFIALTLLIIGIGKLAFNTEVNGFVKLPETGTETTTALNSTYEITAGTAPVSTGTFIVAADIGAPGKIDNYLNEIKLLKMDTIIVNALEVQNGTCAKPTISWVNGMPGNLPILMNQARNKGIDVYLGLIVSEGCSAEFYNVPNKTAVIKGSATLVNYVVDKFGTYSNFKGWYIPDEPALALWDDPSLTYNYYARIVDTIRRKSNLPIIVSPYLTHTNFISPATVAQRALAFQDNTGITIQAWQDSVGGDSTSLIYARSTLLRSYYQSIVKSIGKVHFWVNNELFDYGISDPTFTGPFYKPTSMTRLLNQYKQSTGLGNKNIVWVQMHHLGTVMTTPYNPDAKRLMDSYMAYYGIKPYKWIKPMSYTWNESPNATYPDTNKQLTDSITGDPKSILDPAWIGFPNGKATVQLKLNAKKNIRWVGFHMQQKTDSGVEFADTYKLSCSIDNINWTTLGEYKLPISKLDGEYTFANNIALNTTCLSLKAELTNSGKWLFLSEVEIVTNL